MLPSIVNNKLITIPRRKQGWRTKLFKSCILLLVFSHISTGLSAIRNENHLDQKSDKNSQNEYHIGDEDTNARDKSSSYGTQQEDGYLLLCLTDGSIYSVSAWTGTYQSKIRTNPLLQTNHQEDDINSSKNAVIPGLDGRLYWTNEQTQQLHELPLTIHSLLENPVRSCDPYHPEVDCGILTAEAETSLIALSPTGKLMWKTAESNSAGDEDNNYDETSKTISTSKQLQALGTQPALFLQRKDYWVQHVLASTGRQSWNVSLGTYQALDFGPEEVPDENSFDDESSWSNDVENNNEEEEYRFGDDLDESLLTNGVTLMEEIVGKRQHTDIEWHSKQRKAKLRQIQLQKRKKRHLLPSVHFSNSGHTLTAIHPVSGDILWRQDVPSVLSSVFGIHNGQWRTLDVLERRDDLFDDTSDNFQGEDLASMFTPPSNVRSNPLLLTESENDDECTQFSAKENIRKLFDNHDYYYQQILWQQYQKRPNGLDNILKLEAHNQRQQKVNNPNNGNMPLLLLPSGNDNTINNHQITILNKKNDQICSVLPNKILKNSRSCPAQLSTILELDGPTNSPRLSSKPSKVVLQSQPEGLLLSWTVVCIFVVVIVTSVVGFYFWYKQKKANWINESDTARKQQNGHRHKLDSNDSRTAASTVSFETESFGGFQKTRTRSVGSPHLSSQQSLFKRSLSLPGTWNDNGLGKQTIDIDHKSPILVGNNIVDRASGNNVSKPSDFALPEAVVNNRTYKGTPSNNNDQNATSTTVGGFPLVQYSRYASEFQEIRPMGKGGFGTVFRCTNVLDSRDYAIKKVSITSSLITTNNAKSSTSIIFQQQLQRVLREVKVLAVLDHPNIVRYYTAWLEIMKDDDDSNKRSGEANRSGKARSEDFTGEVSSASSHCYSSSLLLASDSVSQWDVSSRGRRFTSGRSFRPMIASRNKHNPLGWDGTGFLFDESGSSDQESLSRYQRSPGLQIAASTDDYLIFDDDDNYVDEQSQSDNNQENTVPTSSSLSFQKGQHVRSKSDSASSNESLFHDEKATSYHVHGSNNSNFHNFANGGKGGGKRTCIDSTLLHSSKSTLSKRVSIETKDLIGPLNHPVQLQEDTDIASDHNNQKTKVRHTLYIQMELCSQKTVADFLQDPELRCVGRLSAIHSSSIVESSNKGHIDIPKALRLFLQIAEAVKHVHNQGLIHRDLKPSNCFLNEPYGGTATVKVGDFGLSRHEHATNSQDSDTDDLTRNGSSINIDNRIGQSEDHTAGVGTRLYASPEQMNGSDYDSSTDVFSLGIILFELLYPMYTGMERNICLSRLRESLTFPSDWHTAIGNSFPDLEDMIRRMVRREPSSRPTAECIARHVSSILGEFTVLALDLNHNADPEVFLLRVEAEHREDTLGHTMRLIHEIASSFSLRDCSNCSNQVTIVQYGLRSNSSSLANNGNSSAIMEFAIKFNNVQTSASSITDRENDGEISTKPDCQQQNSILFSRLVGKMIERPGIYKVRQISCAGSS